MSDKVKMRSPFMVFNSCMAIAGFAVVMRGPSNGLKVRLSRSHNTILTRTHQLFGTFLACAGTQPQIPFVQGFCQNNMRGSSKRAVASGLTVAFGSIGGIAASTVFREKDFPLYHKGLVATMVFHAGIIVLTCLMAAWFWFQNRRLNAKFGVVESGVAVKEWNGEKREDGSDFGEKEWAERNFRYTL
jgi:hypothetical protein